MKKVLLINTNMEKKPYPVPPLGLCLLASVIDQKYQVRIYDGMFDQGKSLIPLVREFNPDYIGVSIRNVDDMDLFNPSFYLDDVEIFFIRPLKNITAAPVILGGSAFSIFPEYMMKRFEAHYGVFGEAEEVFPSLLDTLDRGADPSDIPGVLTAGRPGFKPGTAYCSLAARGFSEIDRRIDFNPYRSRGAYSIQTKRGCAHRCIYCTYNYIEGACFRTRSAENIADEIEEAGLRLGPVTFEFVDSTFNDPPGHAEAICREIAGRKLNVRLRTMGINPSNVSAGLFDLMIRAGFAQIDCTPDTASPSMLVNFQKNFSLADLRHSAGIIKEFNMPAMWFFIFGGPGESRETIGETFDFIDAHINRYDMVHMTMGLRVYPHTPLYDLALKEKRIAPGDDLVRPYFYISDKLGRDELVSIIHEASLKRPNCIAVTESTPPPEMMAEAMRVRGEQNLTEPMFRTLLRIRHRMFREKGLVPDEVSQ